MELQDINDIHNSANHVHPILGKVFLGFTVAGLAAAKLGLQDAGYVVSIVSGLSATGYYAWRWRREYKEDKKQNSKK
jgi:hypothetical protein